MRPPIHSSRKFHRSYGANDCVHHGHLPNIFWVHHGHFTMGTDVRSCAVVFPYGVQYPNTPPELAIPDCKFTDRDPYLKIIWRMAEGVMTLTDCRLTNSLIADSTYAVADSQVSAPSDIWAVLGKAPPSIGSHGVGPQPKAAESRSARHRQAHAPDGWWLGRKKSQLSYLPHMPSLDH